MPSTIIVDRKPELKVEVKQVSIRSYWLTTKKMRLDAPFYAQDVFQANRLLDESGYEVISVDDLSKDAFYLGRQKRFYADQNVGEPYLMPSELFYFQHIPSKFVYAEKLENKEEWYIKNGWVLLTRSGKLGMPLIATKSLQKFIISDDVIRIIPKSDVYYGFLYAYLSTWLGNALLTKDQYGVAVDHIEPYHVESLRVPLIPVEISKQIHENILKAFDLREKARHLLKESEETLFEKLVISQPKEVAKTNIFDVKSPDLEFRLDASYHIPIVKELQSELQKGKYPLRKIGNEKISYEVFIPNRFKRIYVDRDYGIPFLSGTNIFQIKPYDLKYISRRSTKNLESYLLKEGMVLVTARGTIGRIMPVTKSIEGWSASDNIARIVPNKLHFGFLTTFLNTAYGQYQLIRQVGGSVVSLLEAQHIAEVQIPVPSKEVQKEIGDLVIDAFELKELANRIENDTIETLEDMLTEHRKVEDAIENLKEIEAYAETFGLLGDEEFRESLDQAKKGKLVPYGS